MDFDIDMENHIGLGNYKYQSLDFDLSDYID
jgi:hypothetical protein